MFTPVSQSGLVLIVDEDEIRRFFQQSYDILFADFLLRHTCGRIHKEAHTCKARGGSIHKLSVLM